MPAGEVDNTSTDLLKIGNSRDSEWFRRAFKEAKTRGHIQI